ncbi:roadblock/LC7 domain-containing protein [Methanofollis formosanus]|uniref:Roadblock/LC7 domain-containing protein n=1 Tax=Methanofollis formosanus TaxID=299308 RepID=A0A8G1A281_9EURY|nr:roadblock/LC7 domain-containing protein [Methanofollis formosanus]QYZ78732.1 roadblock/LC7 domain-containing protein [Methanofollis formosanus]
MTLPDGRSFGSMTAPLEEVLPFTSAFRAVVRIRSEDREGFVLSDEGKPVAAGYQDASRNLKGNAALEYLSAEPSLSYELSRYSDEEYTLALAWCERMGCLTGGEVEEFEPEPEAFSEPEGLTASAQVPELDNESLNLVLSQPGVVAVSAFYEGFAVHSAGAADFERIAAISEDLLRSSSRIAGDMEMGPLDQIILETPGGKLIIAPFGDLSICVLARANANLGLVRLALRSLVWRG